MYIKGYHRDITPADVDEMFRHLLSAKEMHEREIELSQQVAAALSPIAHYTRINRRVAEVIKTAIAESNAGVYYSRRKEWDRPNTPEYVTVSLSVGQAYGSKVEFARAYARVDINATVADLISAFAACEYSRTELARVEAQISRMEEVIDAEERIRALVKEIEETRRSIALDIIGTEGNYWHDSVREKLPALAGER